MQQVQTLILNPVQIEKKINRLAYQIYEDCAGEKQIILAGIVANGYVLAQKLAVILKGIAPFEIIMAKVDVGNKQQPVGTQVTIDLSEAELQNKTIILVDDVLNSGKTLIYSLTPFINVPLRKLRTVVLVDRNHKKYPISADFVGLSLATTLQEHITVDFTEKKESVYLS